MNNNIRIVLCSVIAAVVVSLLYLVVPATDTFVVSHIFSLIAISGIAVSLCVFGKGNNKAPQAFAYIHTAVIYAVISTVISVIACIISYYKHFPAAITVVVHMAILAVFVIRAVALNSGNEYIEKIDAKAEEKHKEFLNEKESYWK
ncbi:MAG: hypothetical protein MRZ66_03320 [Clostridiales bacterium]|nr:hypothetical protein [Clostridiales bacterium]